MDNIFIARDMSLLSRAEAFGKACVVDVKNSAGIDKIGNDLRPVQLVSFAACEESFVAIYARMATHVSREVARIEVVSLLFNSLKEDVAGSDSLLSNRRSRLIGKDRGQAAHLARSYCVGFIPDFSLYAVTRWPRFCVPTGIARSGATRPDEV